MGGDEYSRGMRFFPIAAGCTHGYGGSTPFGVGSGVLELEINCWLGWMNHSAYPVAQVKLLEGRIVIEKIWQQIKNCVNKVKTGIFCEHIFIV